MHIDLLWMLSVLVAAAFGLLASAAHWIGGLRWWVALLFSALTAVTGPTVIMPVLRSVRPNMRIANVLCWESEGAAPANGPAGH